MGIVSFLLILGAGFTGLAGILKAVFGNKSDTSPKIGKGFFEAFKDACRRK